MPKDKGAKKMRHKGVTFYCRCGNGLGNGCYCWVEPERQAMEIDRKLRAVYVVTMESAGDAFAASNPGTAYAKLLAQASSGAAMTDATREVGGVENVTEFTVTVALHKLGRDAVQLRTDALAKLPDIPAERGLGIDRVYSKLQQHTRKAVEHIDSSEQHLLENLTGKDRVRYLTGNENVRAQLRGTAIENYARQRMQQDPFVRDHVLTGKITPGADMRSAQTTIWFDITTSREWSAHAWKAGTKGYEGFGLPLFTDPAPPTNMPTITVIRR